MLRFALVLAALLVSPPALSARTWYVNPDGTGDAPTIQAAVDSAAVGETVELACGTYYESALVIDSELLLRSASGSPDCVTIDAQQADRHIKASAPLRVEGIRFVGGSASTADPWLGGGAIIAYLSQSLTLERCRFEGNYAPWRGGAVFVQSGSLTIVRCDFIGNSIGFNDLNGPHAGAVFTQYADVIIHDSAFLENVAGPGHYNNSGGGAMRCYRGSLQLSDCKFWNNLTFGNGDGGAIVVTWADADIINCDFRGNTGREGGAIKAWSYGSGRFRNCLFSQNVSRGIGSVYAGTSGGYDPTFDHCTLVDNEGGGAAIYFRGNLLLSHTVIQGSVDAAAVVCIPLDTELSVSCSNAFGNDGGDWTDCLLPFQHTEGNISADPLFCDPDAGNYDLQSASPCLPANSPDGCGLIGAFGFGGCNSVSVTPDSWARVKARYR